MELLLDLFGATPLGGDILQFKGLDDLFANTNLLADGIDEVELRFWKHDGKGNAWEAAACAEVHDTGVRLEADEFGYSKGVQDVVLVEVVDVLARDDVYLAVPVVIERIEGSELLLLPLGKGREILSN